MALMALSSDCVGVAAMTFQGRAIVIKLMAANERFMLIIWAQVYQRNQALPNGSGTVFS